MEFKTIKDLKNLFKSYIEGIYVDNPTNRKLGRVGLSYKEYKNLMDDSEEEEPSEEEKTKVREKRWKETIYKTDSNLGNYKDYLELNKKYWDENGCLGFVCSDVKAYNLKTKGGEKLSPMRVQFPYKEENETDKEKKKSTDYRKNLYVGIDIKEGKAEIYIAVKGVHHKKIKVPFDKIKDKTSYQGSEILNKYAKTLIKRVEDSSYKDI